MGIHRSSLSNQCYLHLKESILQGKIQLGEKLYESKIADELGVSRSPIREAIYKLSSEGLVVSYPNAGSFVVDLNRKDVLEIYDVREALECKAVYLACERITTEEIGELEELIHKTEKKISEEKLNYYPQEMNFDFHIQLIKLSQNALLNKFILLIYDKLKLLRSCSGNEDRIDTALRDHQKIIEIIKDKNAEEAVVVMKEHITNSRRNLINKGFFKI